VKSSRTKLCSTEFLLQNESSASSQHKKVSMDLSRIKKTNKVRAAKVRAAVPVVGRREVVERLAPGCSRQIFQKVDTSRLVAAMNVVEPDLHVIWPSRAFLLQARTLGACIEQPIFLRPGCHSLRRRPRGQKSIERTPQSHHHTSLSILFGFKRTSMRLMASS
jgi:hypothetical protein